MPIEKNQPFTFVFPSRKLDGSPNGTTAPTVTISKDGAAGVAVVGAQLVEGMALTWKITFTADQMNCTSLAIEHTGAGLEVWGTTLCPEAVYTAARGNNLANLDVAVSTRNSIAPDNAGIVGAVATAYGAAVSAKESADAAARPGAAMTLQAGEYTAIGNRVERAGGVLALTKTNTETITSLQENGPGNVPRFKMATLALAPIGDGSTGENLAALNGTVGALQISMNRIAGLTGENQVSRDFVYDGAGTILSFTIRSYDTAANAETDDGATGLLGEYSVTNTLSQDGLVEATTTTLNP